MNRKKYNVTLTQDERNTLTHLVSSKQTAKRKSMHAQILLYADEASSGGALKDTAIAESVHCSRMTVIRIRKRFAKEGIEAALNPKLQKRYRARKLDAKGEAFLIATANSSAPKGHANWTLKLLANRLMECEIVQSISPESVRKTLKRTKQSLG